MESKHECRVLVVEDDPSVRETLVLTLEALGRTVEAVGDAESAIVALEGNWPDVLLLDLTLHESMPGDALFREITSRFGLAPPTVFLSGVPGGERRVAAQAASGVFFLSKPSTLEALESAVDAALEWGRSQPGKSRLRPKVA